MLTIQPSFTTKPVRKIAFKGEGAESAEANGTTAANDPSDTENRFYQSKVNHYEQQVKGYEEALEDENTPNMLKRVIKIFKVASEALLEGWAVAWGAKKGANVIKTPLVNSNFAKGTAKIFKGAGKGLGKVASAISEGYSKIKATKFMTENSVGKAISSGLGYIEKVFSYIGKKVSQWTAPLKGAKAEAIYDKAANVTSKTFGVGAGAAGAYNAATEGKKPEENDAYNNEVKSETNTAKPETKDEEFVEDKKFPGDGE